MASVTESFQLILRSMHTFEYVHGWALFMKMREKEWPGTVTCIKGNICSSILW